MPSLTFGTFNLNSVEIGPDGASFNLWPDQPSIGGAKAMVTVPASLEAAQHALEYIGKQIVLEWRPVP